MNANEFDDDAGYGSEGESYDAGIQQQQQQQQQQVEDEVPNFDHVESKDLANTETITISLGLRASPAELAKDKSKAVLKLPPHILQRMTQKLCFHDRDNPTPDQIAGSIDKLVVSNLESVMITNGFHDFVDTHIGGQVPSTLSNMGEGTCGLQMPPTGGVALVLKEDLLNPINRMHRDMLQIYQECDPSILKREFQTLNDGTGVTKCLIYADGVAARLVKAEPHQYENFKFNKFAPETRMAIAPAHISEKLYNYMDSTIKQIEK